MRRRLRALSTALLVACNDSEPSPPTFTLPATQQWSGGSLTIRSDFFRGSASLPAVKVAGVAVTLTRMDDTTVSAVLPVLSSQDATVEVIDGSNQYVIGVVEIFGFRARKESSPALIWEPVASPSPGGPVAVAGVFPQPVGGSIGILNLRTAQTQVVTGVQPASVSSGHGVGPTFDPTRLILRDSAGVVGEWQVLPALAYADTVPAVPFSRNVARLSDEVWLFTSNHNTIIRRAGAPDIDLQVEDPWAFHLSVAADRALLSSALMTGGAPVVEMSTGDTLYRLPLTGVNGAAFTGDGSTLYAVGDAGVGLQNVIAVNSSTGAMSGNTTLPLGGSALGLALNAVGTRLFVSVLQDSVPEILVYETGSLSLVGRLAASDDQSCSCLDLNTKASLATDDATDTIFLMGGGDPTYIWEFDILPEVFTTSPIFRVDVASKRIDAD